ncbi:MAG TPA: nucleoside permease [Chitinophagaceae bacterium]|nr:nucleoside permease [Chitinophagaceae bacterium]
MKLSTRSLLSGMMFLEFFIWGSWYVTMSTYLSHALHASGIEIGAAYSAMSIATILSPLFIGMVADRFFAAQKLLGLLHLAGAFLLYLIISVKAPAHFYWYLLLYSLIYAPTLALANSIAFRQMKNPGTQFPGIRVFGTAGWIVTGILIDKVFHISPGALSFTFRMAAVASLALGLFSFLLPHTPPQARGEKVTLGKLLGTDALGMLKDRSFLVFFIASILICIPLSFYYSLANDFLVDTGMANATANMTLGQFSEALFILAIPLLIRRIGIRNMILMGMIAWMLRFLCFGFGNAGTGLWMLFAGIILHGACFDFFFVTGQIYTDYKAGEKIKSSAQGLITLATYGIGMWIGTLMSGYVAQYFSTGPNEYNWRAIWMVPAVISAAVFLFFISFFRESVRSVHQPLPT